MPNTSLVGKMKQCNKQFEVVAVGDGQQETSLVSLQCIILVIP